MIYIIKLVIFDLDGTLLNTLGDLHASVNFALREFSFPERTLDEVRSFIGNGVVKLMERSTPDGTNEETNKACLDLFRQHYLEHMADTTAPYEGVIPLIERLKSDGVKIAVVSNKLHSAVEKLCEDYFPGLIEKAIGVSVESERKPSPINVIKAMELFGAEREETLYVGDSEVDAQTAAAAEVKCVGVSWGFRTRQQLLDAGCDIICDTCDEVYAVCARN